ncbi:MAG: large repetitive protein, partial [Mycobacterium sp.]|nr:large repetitive protein [Mycobacterium sp.]
MCANTSKHRVARARKGASSTPGVWAAKQILDGASMNPDGPKHAVKVATNYAKYVGRVGALAVSLGVGMAAPTPGVAWAGTDHESDGAASGGSDGATASSSAAGPSTSGGTTTTSRATTTGASTSSGTETSTSGTSTDPTPSSTSSSGSTPSTGNGDGVPKMNVSSSGGEHTSTYGSTGKSEESASDTSTHTDEQTTGTSTGGAAASSSTESSGATGTTGASSPTEDPVVVEVPPTEPTPPAAEAPKGSTAQPTEAPAAEQNNDHKSASAKPTPREPSGADGTTGTEADSAPTAGVRALSVVADQSAEPPALQTNALSSLVVTSPPVNPIAALLRVPVTIVDAFSGFVTALLTPLLSTGPSTPIQVPVLWTVLAFLRREIEHTFFNRSPIANPSQNIGQALTGAVTGNLNASDPNGDPISAAVTQQGQYGIVTIASNGTYTYTPTVAVPATGLTDTFQVAINDSGLHLGGVVGLVQKFFEGIARCIGLAQPDTIVKTVAVTVAPTGVVTPGGVPSVVVTTGVLLYNAGDGPKTLDPSVTVIDIDSTMVSAATVKISVGYNPLTDTLAYAPSSAPITSNFDSATGTLTLSGTATLAQYQTALRAVTFDSTTGDLVGTRAVSIVVTADQIDSLPGVVAVVVTGVPTSVPTVVATTPVKLYTGGGAGSTLDPNVTLVDIDS